MTSPNGTEPELLLPGQSPSERYFTRHTRLAEFKVELRRHAIEAQEISGNNIGFASMMHDLKAPVPALVVSPKSEWGVSKVLTLMKQWNLYDQFQVSVKSGGHGYFNGGSCPDIMINLGLMNQRSIMGETLSLQPGCVLAEIIDMLATHGKAVPHGDCFGVGAGGHFLTAGWDPILSRCYALGCQSIIGGRVVLWDGEVVEVNEETHPRLLYAMRGGAVAEAGVVTQIRLQLIEQPDFVTWRCTPITGEQLQMCIKERVFQKAALLPRDISASFQFYFEPCRTEPVCSFNIFSLRSVGDTIHQLIAHVGQAVTQLVNDESQWGVYSLLNVRLLSASTCLSENPGMLAEASAGGLLESPGLFWDDRACLREMAPSYVHAISYWVKLDCEKMLMELWSQFDSVKESKLRFQMYALVIIGGGAITERKDYCSMPLGQALARFNFSRDKVQDNDFCEAFTSEISSIMGSYEDRIPGRPYRGDIWQADQAYVENDVLKDIQRAYSRRSSSNAQVAEYNNRGKA